MLNILKSLTGFLLRHEQRVETSCDIPDESIDDWARQVSDEIAALSGDPEEHHIRLEQLQAIQQHLATIQDIRDNKCQEEKS